MKDKKFQIIGTKVVTFSLTVSAASKSAAIKKGRAGDVEDQKVIAMPTGFVLGKTGRVLIDEIKN